MKPAIKSGWFLRALVIFALVGVVGTAAAFRGGALPGPGPVPSSRVESWSMLVLGGIVSGPVSGTVVGRFTTGPTSSTLSSLKGTVTFAPTGGGAATNTYSVTDTSGTPVCSFSMACNAMTLGALGQNTACAASLAANTEYQFRITGVMNCTGSAHIAITAQVAIP